MFQNQQSGYSMEGMKEEDEVIRELDVFVNNDMLLYLAQFPLKPVYSEPIDVQTAKFKPNHHKIEISAPYPPSIRKAILATEKASTASEVLTQKFVSSEIEQSNTLMTGFIQNNQLFLSSIDHVLQFHPLMNQEHANIKVELLEADTEYDKIGEEESGAMGGGNSSSNAGGGENAKSIQLKRKESEKAQNARLQSYSYLKQQEDAEPWINLKPYAIGKRAYISFVHLMNNDSLFIGSRQSDAKFSEISGDIAGQR